MKNNIDTFNYKIFDIFCNNKSTLNISLLLLCSDSYQYKNQTKENKIINEVINKNGKTGVYIDSRSIYLSISNKSYSLENGGSFSSLLIPQSHIYTIQHCFDSIINHYKEFSDDLFVFNNKGEIIGEKVIQTDYKEKHCQYNPKGGLFKVKIKTLESKNSPNKLDLMFHLMSQKEDTGTATQKRDGISVLLTEAQFVVLNRKLVEIEENIEILKMNLLQMYMEWRKK